MKKQDKDLTYTTCCMTGEDPWSAKQHHWKSEAKKDRQLSSGGPSAKRKCSGPNQLK